MFAKIEEVMQLRAACPTVDKVISLAEKLGEPVEKALSEMVLRLAKENQMLQQKIDFAPNRETPYVKGKEQY